MARAHRHYIPGCVWHITHRCHKQEFLLKFAKDRKRWRHWLYVAKKRYGLCVLNYIATSNHIHLLVVDTGEDVIARSLQLIAGRTGQDFNIRKKRKGAFWEDRYHATAVQTDEHLAKCLVYIDLNMVRAGVVRHPSEYAISGYNEIHNPPKRYAIINRQALLEIFSFHNEKDFLQEHHNRVEIELKNNSSTRNSLWSESVAVGGEHFVEDIKQRLAGRVQGRSFVSHYGISGLKEPQATYKTLFDGKKGIVSLDNAYLLDFNSTNSKY
jgi:putative transposase